MGSRYVNVDAELNAIVEFDKTFPCILSRDDLSEYKNGFVNWHKQPTAEISFVTKGAVEVYVLSEKITVSEGSGFVIMPGNFHSVMPSPEAEAAIYFTFIFHPEVLYGKRGSFFECEYYTPFVQNGAAYFTFSKDENWGREMFEKAGETEAAWTEPNAEFKLRVQRALQDIWIALYRNVLLGKEHSKTQKDTKKIFEMISYIHAHYAEKFSLTDMAEQLAVSRSECCRFFKRSMLITISDYLTEYRLTQAIQLLENSTMSITEIAMATGFCDASYFIRKFREKLNCSPQKYRNKMLVQ